MKKMKIKFLLLYIAFLFPFGLYAATPEEADSAYKAQDFAKAILLYEEIEKEQGISPELLYNLGNAYYEASDYANAMLCYERAYRLDPSKKEIRENLLYLRTKVEDANRAEQKGKKQKVEEDELTFFQGIHKAIAVEIHSDRWAVWGVVSFFLFLVCIALYIFTKGVITKKIGFFGGFILLGTTIICVVFSCLGASEFNRKEDGIILSYKTALLEEPVEKEITTKQNNVLTRGTKVRVIAEETDAQGNVTWYKVRLNSSYIGWIKADDLAII